MENEPRGRPGAPPTPPRCSGAKSEAAVIGRDRAHAFAVGGHRPPSAVATHPGRFDSDRIRVARSRPLTNPARRSRPDELPTARPAVPQGRTGPAHERGDPGVPPRQTPPEVR